MSAMVLWKSGYDKLLQVLLPIHAPRCPSDGQVGQCANGFMGALGHGQLVAAACLSRLMQEK